MTQAPYLLPKAREGYRMQKWAWVDSMIGDGPQSMLVPALPLVVVTLLVPKFFFFFVVNADRLLHSGNTTSSNVRNLSLTAPRRQCSRHTDHHTVK